MTTEVKHYMDPESEAETLTALARDLAAMPARLKRAREMERDATDKATAAVEAHRVEAAAHQAAIAEAESAHREKCAKDKDEIARARAAVETERRELHAERLRIIDREKWVEHRAADLGQRARGVA
jgi:hypothetical protein